MTRLRRLLNRILWTLTAPPIERQRRLEPPENGKLHFLDGPIVNIPAATPEGAIDQLTTHRRIRRAYRQVQQ
jgi:CRISPR/Cas system CMR subunit Cmr4 (Cas7 group RAMP superfamily)